MVALKHDALTQQALGIQRLATDPDSHIWLSASAGTGKTKVLTDRLLNLLLKGVNPRKILCLTYTQAAASEMMQRLLDRLGYWASCSEIDLRRDLHLLRQHPPSQELEARARRIFVDILEIPGGFRIQTIHSFCQSLLASFPLEAGLSVDMRLLTDQDRQEKEEQAQERLFRACVQDPELEQAVTLLAGNFHTSTFKDLCRDILKERIKMGLVLASGIASAQGNTVQALNLGEEDLALSPLMLFKKVWNEGVQGSLKKIAPALLKGSSTDQKRGQGIISWLGEEKTLDSFQAYSQHFLTTEGIVRQKLATRQVLDSWPEAEAFLGEEASRVQEMQDAFNRVKIARISVALLRVSEVLLTCYAGVKKEHNALDYDDLILKAQDLLRHEEFSPWILYKLDGGIDHLLIDEAQDTNKVQWDIIKALTEEFFAGEGARSGSRTLFVVGDIKQSIYSFQGTDPTVYAAMSSYFSQGLEGESRSWKNLDMRLSFRSVSPILDFVDRVFTAGMRGHQEETPLKHLCFRTGQGGHVEVWPVVTSTPCEEVELTQSPQEALAHRVADHIEMQLQQRPFLSSRGRPLEAGDILVLIRKRTEFVATLLQILKSKGIPVGGLDRLNLLEDLAIQDFIALSEFLLLPENDFALACVLKSPFGGLTEEDMFGLATGRGEKTLWRALKERRSSFEETVDALTALLNKADFVSPFRLYSEMLFAHQGLQKIMKRFGSEVLDPVEEFLSLAYAYQGHSPASLQGFLQWIQKGTLEIKRDFSQPDLGKVRIMTVHGAKGLQAPVVILADTGTRPTLKQRFLWNDPENKPPLCLWCPPKNEDIALTRALKQQARTLQDQEYERLLYVALTRAEDQLYLCGAHDITPQGSWHHLAESALAQNAEKISLPWGEGWRLEHSTLPSFSPAEVCEDRVEKDSSLPGWLFEEVPEEVNTFARIAVTESVSSSQDSFASLPAARGRLIHELLEVLPGLTSEACAQVIAFRKRLWTDAVESFEQAIVSVKSILEDATLKPLFQGNSKAEVSLTGVYEGQLYTARIDRLVVFEKEVFIVDYKTDAQPPMSCLDVDLRYKNQLKLYRELVKPLYPDHHIKTVILWTETRHLMDIPV